MKPDINKIVDKIKKLLTLATSPNEHEAQAAAAKAHRLLIQYNLDLQQVKDRPPSHYVKNPVDTRIFQRAEEKFVSWILEEHFFVKWIQHRVPNDDRWGENLSKSTWYDRHITLIGTAANVEVATYVRMFLIDKFYQLWLEYKRQNDLPARFQQSYYRGLYEGLDAKLKAQRHSIEDERGLVLVKDPMLDELTKDAKNGGKAHYNSGLDDDIIEDGIDDGRKIEIQRALSAEGVKNKGLQIEHKGRKRE